MDAFLFDAGWFFFAALIVVLVGLSITAFGRDLLPRNQPSPPSSNSLTPRTFATRRDLLQENNRD